jgi:pyruvate kinase
MRPRSAMILAFTPSLETLRQLRFLRGVEPYLMAFSADPDVTIESALQQLRHLGRIAAGAKLIVVTDILSQDRLVDSIQLRTVR